MMENPIKNEKWWECWNNKDTLWLDERIDQLVGRVDALFMQPLAHQRPWACSNSFKPQT